MSLWVLYYDVDPTPWMGISSTKRRWVSCIRFDTFTPLTLPSHRDAIIILLMPFITNKNNSKGKRSLRPVEGLKKAVGDPLISTKKFADVIHTMTMNDLTQNPNQGSHKNKYNYSFLYNPWLTRFIVSSKESMNQLGFPLFVPILW